MNLWRRISWCVLRVRLVFAKWELAKAETELGMLGWQQADFLTPEMQEHARQIMDFEREEAAIFNREAELSERMREVEELRNAAREQAAAIRIELESQAAALKAERDDGKALADEKREHVTRFDRSLSELDREVAGLELIAAKLQAIDTREARAEWERVREQRQRLANEAEGLRRARALKTAEVIGIEEKLAWSKQRLDAVEQELREKREMAGEAERKFSHEIETLERGKKQGRKIADAMNKEKRSPFRVIGACLAESEIAPLNQPGALDRVYAARLAVGELEDALAGCIQPRQR